MLSEQNINCFILDVEGHGNVACNFTVLAVYLQQLNNQPESCKYGDLYHSCESIDPSECASEKIRRDCCQTCAPITTRSTPTVSHKILEITIWNEHENLSWYSASIMICNWVQRSAHWRLEELWCQLHTIFLSQWLVMS